MHRFYIPPASWDLDALTLDPGESHHCTSVLRCRTGEKVVAFNGRGLEVTSTIASTGNGIVTLDAIGTTKSEPLPARITLGQAIPKGKTMDLIVQKATELGTVAIAPLLSERTVVTYATDEAEKKKEKWQKVAVEACKQSGQNWLPEVSTPQTIDKFFAGSQSFDLLLIASLETGARHLSKILSEATELSGGRPQDALLLIGPEGDFTPSETNVAKSAGCLPLGLGPIVLRAETAAIYALSILGYELFPS